ncbi:MAG: hypothetical protein IJ829_08135 [Kiritimatiellae bacterium]|nr:hypothetical protein [Kiritimatiellia bacterium]
MKERTFVAVLALAVSPVFAPAAVYVSPDGTGDGSSPDSPAALAASVLSAAAAGETIVAAAGTYELAETLTLANSSGGALTLQGESRDETVFTLAPGAAGPLFAVGAGTLRRATIRDVSTAEASVLTLSSGTIDSLTVSGCAATGSGHYIVYATAAAATVTNCLVANCSSGSILYSDTKDATLYDTTVSGCAGASGNSYGKCIRYWTGYRCTVDGFSVSGEEAIFNATLYDCLVSGVTGTVFRSTTLYNSTIRACRGTLNDAWKANKYYNCLLWNNLSGTAANAALSPVAGSLYSCWLEEGVDSSVGTRAGCLTGTDAKLGADGTLSAGSPCIDAGDNSYWSSYQSAKRTKDLFGGERVANATIDIGCFEKNGYLDGETFFSLDQTVLEASAGDTVSAAFLYRADAGVTVTVTWDFGDGTASEQTVLAAVGGSAPGWGGVSHVYAVGGAYDVSASVSFSDGSAGVSAKVAGKFLVQNTVAGDVYVSTSGSDANSGLSAAAAKATVASAVTAVCPGYRVVIKPGTYDVGFETVVAKAVEILGESRDAVVLTGAADSRIFTLDNASAVLRDLTIRGVTNAVPSGGALLALKQGTVSGVVFDRCRAAATHMVYATGSSVVVSNCVAVGCKSCGIFYDSANTEALLADTTIRDCAGDDGNRYGQCLYGWKAYRCTVEGFRPTGEEAIFKTRLYDCLVSGTVGRSFRGIAAYNVSVVGCQGPMTDWEQNKYYNCLFLDNRASAAADAALAELGGSLCRCWLEEDATGGARTDCLTGSDPRLKATFVPRSSSPVVGAAKYMNDAGTAVDATYFPNAARRAVDLAGLPRVRTRTGQWLDIGCLQGVLGQGLGIFVR